MTRRRAVAAMQPDLIHRLFDDPTTARLHAAVDLAPSVITDFADDAVADRLAEVEVLLTCWGAPPLTADVLAAAPRLRAVVHAAGSVKEFVTAAMWERGIVVSSAAVANARPVAEFTVAAIVFANKRILDVSGRYAERRSAWEPADIPADIGNHRRVVGIVGASRIGRLVLELLSAYDLEVLLADPFVTAAEAHALGARAVELDELCAASDVVTLHAPALPSTRHLVDARRLALLRDGATLINTARGTLVDTAALTTELASGRIHAVLDHTDPELLPDDSPLYDLPNVLLTPHVAGSLGNELHRLGAAAVAELERFAAGRPFLHPVTRNDLGHSA